MQALANEVLIEHLNKQTAKITWPELERAFAQGLLLQVAENLDLLTVALDLIRDNTTAIKNYLDTAQLNKVTDMQAQQWQQQPVQFWGLVAAPWVLIQNVQET